MKKLLLTTIAISYISIGSALAADTSMMMSKEYEVTITNTMKEELFAPVIITSTSNDMHIFDGDYVTSEAEIQILTGDPGKLVGKIGKEMVTVAHGSDGPPGVLLAPGKSITFSLKTDATSIRVLSMIAPTIKKDNYVSAVIDLAGAHMGGIEASLMRYDIGHDEGTKSITSVSSVSGSVMIK